MDNALVRFIGLAPKDVIELICNYLDFSDFLALTSVSRYLRSILVNHHLFWLNYYMKRVNFRHYETDIWFNDKSLGKYQLRMPSFDKRHEITDPANRLLNSARKVEIMSTYTALSTNPMLNLSILDNFKRSRWKGEFKQYTENLSKFILPTMVVPTLGCNPFLLVSNSSVCGFNMNEDKFMFNNFMTPLNDYRRHEIKICCWVRLDDVSYTQGSKFRSVTSRMSYVPKILVIVYRTDTNTLSMPFYCYDGVGFVNVPSMSMKMSIDADDDVTAIDVYGSLLSWDGRDVCFSHINVFVGTSSGDVLQKRMEEDTTVVERKQPVTSYEITSIRFVSWHKKSVVVVFSHGNYLGVVDVSNDDWNVIENINDPVTTFSIDTPNCIMAYSTSVQNRSTYVDLYNSNNEKAHYLVPKPPFCILSLERDSKWAIVIRNYIRVLQVIHPNEPSTPGKSAIHRQYEDSSSEEGTNEYGVNLYSGYNEPSTCDNSVYGTSESGAVGSVATTSSLSETVEVNSTSGLSITNVTNSTFGIGQAGEFKEALCGRGNSRRGRQSRSNSSNSSNSVNTSSGLSRVNSNSSMIGSNSTASVSSMSSVSGGATGTENELNLQRLSMKMSDEREESSHSKLKFKSICTLNGHLSDITHCAHDGWSKLVTIDSNHNLFVWDYTIGCKIFSFSLLADIKRNSIYMPYSEEFEGRNKKCVFKRTDSRCSLKSDSPDGCNSSHRRSSDSCCNSFNRKSSDGYHRKDQDNGYKKDLDFKRSVKLINRMVTNSEMKDAIEDFLYLDNSDFDASPLSEDTQKTSQRSHRSKNTVPASNIKGLLDPNKKGQKYYVDVSVHSLVVYYKCYNVMQVWSFK